MTAAALAVALVLAVIRPWRRPSGRPRGSRWRARGVSLGAASTRWATAGVVVVAALVAGGPAVAGVAGVLAVAAGPSAARVQRRRQRLAITAAVPDLVDLFLVSASAGLPVAGSLAVVAPRAPVPVAPAVAGARDRFQRGLPLSECLTGLGQELGSAGAPLADALRQGATTGVPLVPLLAGVAASARDARRRRAQEVARRLPVTMLFPLVACILPAAVALAVVPVLLVSISSLRP